MTIATQTLTVEQEQALDAYRTGNSLVLSAYAGSGKTSTILALAGDDNRRGTYLAYNRAIVEDVAREMGRAAPNVQARTAHSLAYAAVGKDFRHRLYSERISSAKVAQMLGLKALEVEVRGHTHRLAAGFLAGCVMDGIRQFCNSAQREPGPELLPAIEAIDDPDSTENDFRYRAHCANALGDAWNDLSHEEGSLRFTHDCYLKLWQLGAPTIPGEVVFVDEAQDVNPVLADVIERQGCQLVAVGDSYQQIYAWRGAVDALARLGHRPGTLASALTASFRFGPEIAKVADRVLEQLGATDEIVGRGGPSSVQSIDRPDAILCRTNAGVMNTLLEEIGTRQCAIVGGGSEMASFAKAYIDLRDRGHSSHRELHCFGSLAELAEFVTNDPSGSDLALQAKLCDLYTPEVIIDALSRTVSESTDDVLTISTAHRAKGRQWPTVRLGPDWSAKRNDTAEELRLAYVAVTRARRTLDLTDAGFLA